MALVLTPVGKNCKLQHTGLTNDFLDSFDFTLINFRHDDFDLAFTIRPNHDLLRATWVDSAGERFDQITGNDSLALISILFRKLNLFDLVDQDRSAAQVNTLLWPPDY